MCVCVDAQGRACHRCAIATRDEIARTGSVESDAGAPESGTRCSWGAADRSRDEEWGCNKIGVEREEAGGGVGTSQENSRKTSSTNCCLSGDYHHPQGRGSLLAFG